MRILCCSSPFVGWFVPGCFIRRGMKSQRDNNFGSEAILVANVGRLHGIPDYSQQTLDPIVAARVSNAGGLPISAMNDSIDNPVIMADG